MEADLRRFYHCSAQGMSWVEIGWLVRHLPREAVLSGNDGWSQTDLLISDQIFIKTGKHHPDDPRVIRARKELAARVKAGTDRSAARRKQLGIRGSIFRRTKG